MGGRLVSGARPVAFLIALLVALFVVAASPAGGAGTTDSVCVIVQLGDPALAESSQTLPGFQGG